MINHLELIPTITYSEIDKHAIKTNEYRIEYDNEEKDTATISRC